MRKALSAAAVAAALVILAGGAAILYYRDALARRPSPTVNKTVVIPAGYPTARIGALLESEGLVTSGRVFTWFCRLNGLDGKLEAGRYHLRSGDGIPAIARTLAAGKIWLKRFTVPEGYDEKKTAAAVAVAGICPAGAFLKAAAAGDPRGRVKRKNLEGYLFPDTYEVAADATPADVVTMMVDRFFQVMGPKEQARAAALGRSLDDIVVVASIVEREAMRKNEKPVVASVFYNRLKRGMRLESCATVIYALGRQPDRLTVQDLKVDSPYNTYRHDGLPPGPICSPGKDALLAALYPADTDYLFFVSNGDGSHTFSKTFGAHNAARAAKKHKGKNRK